MRFFKYLIFFFFISFQTHAALSWKVSDVQATRWFGSPSLACADYVLIKGYFNPVVNPTNELCTYKVNQSQSSNSSYAYLTYKTLVCPSATEVTLKVPVNAQKYQCVNQCQYALRGCVDIDFEPGMTCSAISTGIDCGGTPPPKPADPNTTTPDAPTDTPAAPGQNTNNTNTNTATTTGTSTSTSNSTTTNNTTTNTSTTNTTTTTNINTTTKIDLSSLESAIESIGKILGSKLDAIKDAISGSQDQDGGDTGSENGSPDGTDLTETNSKLDDIKKNGTDLNDWLKGDGDKGGVGGEGDNPFGTDVTPEREITPQSLQTNIFGSAAACPADRTLSMSFVGKSFQKTFSFSLWCQQLAILGSLILIAAYAYGAYIIASKS